MVRLQTQQTPHIDILLDPVMRFLCSAACYANPGPLDLNTFSISKWALLNEDLLNQDLWNRPLLSQTLVGQACLGPALPNEALLGQTL